MRTTVRMDDVLFRKLKAHAALTGRSMTAVIEDALRSYLNSSSPRPKRKRVTLTTVGGKGLQPGVDLDNSASLLDLMDRG